MPRPAAGARCCARCSEGTGVAGRPQEFFERLAHSGLPRQPREYFDGVDDAEVLALLAPTDPGAPDASDPIPPRSSGHDAQRGVRRQADVDAPARPRRAAASGPADAGLFGDRLPAPRYVHVTRLDKVAQAVSLWRAVQTRAWRAGEVTDAGDAVYHGGAIGYLAARLAEQDEAWRDWFAEQGIEPLTIVYEELAADTHAATSAVLRPPRRGSGPDPGAAVAPAGRRPLDALVGPLPRRGARMSVSELDRLEAESIHVMREVAAELERPVLLFSGGKDSIVLLRLAEKAFRPGAVPVPGPPRRHRPQLPRGDRVPRPPGRGARRAADRRVRAGGDRRGPRARRRGRRATGCRPRCCWRRSRTHGFDAAFGGARRDEERARAKERIFSFRDEFGQWDPRAPAARGVEPLQRARPPRRARARVPALELDRARRLALHRARGAGAAVDLLRPRARGVRARRDALRRVRVARARATARRSFEATRPLPHGRRHDRAPARCAREAADARRRDRRDRRPRASPSAARRAPTTASSAAAMEDRKREGYF